MNRDLICRSATNNLESFQIVYEDKKEGEPMETISKIAQGSAKLAVLLGIALLMLLGGGLTSLC